MTEIFNSKKKEKKNPSRNLFINFKIKKEKKRKCIALMLREVRFFLDHFKLKDEVILQAT